MGGKEEVYGTQQKEKEDVKLGEEGRYRKNGTMHTGKPAYQSVSTNINFRIRLLPKLLFKTI